jgi:hypothetical protein
MKKVNLSQTVDARVWAKEWLKTIEKNPSIPSDEGTMIEWFANAIMAGHDDCYQKYHFAMTEDTYKETKAAYKRLTKKVEA